MKLDPVACSLATIGAMVTIGTLCFVRVPPPAKAFYTRAPLVTTDNPLVARPARAFERLKASHRPRHSAHPLHNVLPAHTTSAPHTLGQPNPRIRESANPRASRMEAVAMGCTGLLSVVASVSYVVGRLWGPMRPPEPDGTSHLQSIRRGRTMAMASATGVESEGRWREWGLKGGGKERGIPVV